MNTTSACDDGIDAPQYQIRLQGHLDVKWSEWFEGMTVTLDADGTTLLSGPVPDQPALYGLLRKVRDLGLPLVSVNLRTNAADQQYLHKVKKGEIKMVASGKTQKLDTKVLLSTLWIVVMINMLKADILSLYIPGATEEVVKTATSAGVSIPQLMLVGAVTMEISIVMIVLSRVLKYGINRWVNIFAGLFIIVFIWSGAASYPHYTFIAAVETLCLLLIIWNAWKWTAPEE